MSLNKIFIVIIVFSIVFAFFNKERLNTYYAIFFEKVTRFKCFLKQTRVFSYLIDTLNYKFSFSNKYSINISVTFLFFIGFLVRFYKFGIIPFGFNQDGAMGAVDALALSNHGTDRFGMWLPVHFTAWGYGQMSVLLSYLTVPFIKIFGLNSFSARVPMLIISLLAIYVLYKFTKDVYGNIQATIILFLCAINPWHIMQSRWALDCNLLPHFTLFSLFFLYKGLKSEMYLYVSMFFFAISMYSYGTAFFFIPPLLIVLCIYLLLKTQITFCKVLKCALVYILFSMPIILVMAINYLKLPTIQTPFFTIGFFENSVRSKNILLFSDNFYNQFTSNFKTLINVVFLQKEDLPWNAIKEFGSTYIFNLPFLIIGFLYGIKNLIKTNDNDLKVAGNAIFIFWFISSIFTGLFINDVNINRINVIFYPIIVFSGIGLYNIFFNRQKVTKLSVVVLSIYTFSFLLFTNSYFVKTSENLGYYYFRGFGESIQSAELKESDIIYVTTNTYQGSYKQITEILTMFHAKIDSEYFQGKAKSYNKDGLELLPYKKRYIYLDFASNQDIINNANPHSVFVLNMNEAYLFSDEKFIIKPYWDYAVATLK